MAAHHRRMCEVVYTKISILPGGETQTRKVRATMHRDTLNRYRKAEKTGAVLGYGQELFRVANVVEMKEE